MGEELKGAQENWKQRTYGLLPEGSKVKTGVVDTKNYIEQGERTWTTGQTVRDILQNHLDANTQRYFDQLISSVIDTTGLSAGKLNPAQQENFDEFSYTLFRYRKGLEDFSPQAEAEIKTLLDKYAQGLPLKRNCQNFDGTVNFESIKATISSIEETSPRVQYRVVDQTQGSNEQTEKWVDWQEMQSFSYLEQISSSGPTDKVKTDPRLFRYQITAVQILDEGIGFDSKLTAFYKSTKIGKRHLRGKFGEGTKMSETHLVRNGAKVKMRSSYQINSGENRDRVWQQRPYVGDDQTVKLQSIEVDLPHAKERQFGSFTLVEIQGANPAFQEDFIKNVDPRVPNQGLAINCLEYSSTKYYYPVVNVDQYTKLAGVSLEADPQCQYVQGLRVGEGKQASGYDMPIFSYDFLDSSILKGRDRSELKNAMAGSIKRFWEHAESPELLEELIRRNLLEKRSASGVPPEFEALRDLIDYNPHYLDAQAKRTQDTVLLIMPGVLGIEPGRKNVVVSDSDLSNPENQILIQTLEAKGYHLVIIANIAVPSNFQRLNEYYKGELEVYTLDFLRKDIDALVGRLDAKSEKVRFADTLYKSAYDELKRLVQRAGLGNDFRNFIETPTYLETVDPKIELPVELVFDQETQMFKLKIRPDLILAGLHNGKGADYWQRRIQVEILAALGRKEAFPDRNTALMQSQKNAQELLDKTLHAGMVDVDALPSRFNHEIQSPDEITSMNFFINRLKDIERSLVGMEVYDQAREFQITFADCEAIIQRLAELLPSNNRDTIKRILANRLIVENGRVGFFTSQDTKEGNKLLFTKRKIEDLEVVATFGERKVYKADNRLFVLQDIPDGSVVKMNEYRTLVMYKGKILNFERYHFGEYDFSSFPLTLDRGCLSVQIPFYKRDFNEELGNLEKGLSGMTVTTPEKGKTKGMKTLKGAVETPLPIEYGIDEWDNPIRVFEDIVQNHIDATPNGKADLNYEVVRGGKRTWVAEASLTDEDRIVGLKIMDRGKGYLPDDLGTMGKSSKKSPMFAGKYGEGQKMVSTAAIRNGLSLSFTSLGEYNGEQYRWTAQVGTKDEELIIEGEKSKAQRVVFNLNSTKEEGEQQFTSATTLGLPDTSKYYNPEWQKWLSIFDPRKKDERGNGGLSRYVINLRERVSPNVIDLGYMRILLDEPGAVYENGLLITREAGRSVVGYDVPEVVTTRERNSYDKSRLGNYIAHAMKDCRDVRYPQTIMRQFKERYLKRMIENPGSTWISEADLNFGGLFLVESGFMSGSPLWDYACATELGSYLIHSEEALKSIINSGERIIKEGYVSDKEEEQKKMEQAQVTLAKIIHIPQDHLIPLPGNYYKAWARIFPTAEEYVRSLAEQRIPVNQEVIQQLTKVITASGIAIRQMAANMQQDEETKTTYASIISERTPNEAVSYWGESAKKKADVRLDFWSDYDQVSKQNAVFVAPANSGYFGLASKDRIGLNEQLLTAEDLRKIAGTGRHELLHKVFGIRDYTPEFVMLLLALAKSNTREASPL